MKQSVRDAFVDFTAALEGVVPWMYLDVKGLVTVAIGNLIDPVAAALSLPFVRKGTTTRATKGEILDVKNTVNAMVDRRPPSRGTACSRRKRSSGSRPTVSKPSSSIGSN